MLPVLCYNIWEMPIPQAGESCPPQSNKLLLTKPLFGRFTLGLASPVNPTGGGYLFPDEVDYFPVKARCQMIQQETDTMNEDRLIKAVNEWATEAIFFIGGAWYSNCNETRNLSEVSSELQLRWLNRSAVKVAIEHRGRGFRWLGGFYLGYSDPMVLDCFTRSYPMTECVISTVESVVKTFLPNITLIKCHFCEDRFNLDRFEDRWLCDQCTKDFYPKIIDVTGFVYIFGSTEQGFYKIGQSKTPPSRLSFYRSLGLPFAVEMLHIIPVDNVWLAETELHNLFEDKATGAEWFKLSRIELARVMNLKRYVAGEWLA